MEIAGLRRTGVVSLAVLATLTGCTITSSTGTPGTVTQPTATSVTLSGSPSPEEPMPTFTLTRVQKFNLGNREAWPIVLTPTEILAPVTTLGGSDPEQVWRLDLSTGDESVVAKTEYPGGAIIRVVASGDWVAWLDEQRVRTDPGPWIVLWKIWAKDLVSGKQVMLDTNGSGTDALSPGSVPTLVSGDGYISWEMTGSDQVVQQYVWQPGTEQPHPLPLQLQGFVGATAINGGNLIFRRLSSDPWSAAQGLGDCWSYPLDGNGEAVQLTHSGLVESCTVSGTDLVWTEHIDPETNTASMVAQIGGHPYTLLTASLDGTSEPQVLYQGAMKPGTPVVGDGFAWWTTSGGTPSISSLTTSAQKVVKTADRVFTWVAAADGQLAAYKLRRPAQSTVIAVVQVVPQPAETPSASSTGAPTSVIPTSPPAP